MRKAGVFLLMMLTVSGCFQRDDQEIAFDRETPVQLEPGQNVNKEGKDVEGKGDEAKGVEPAEPAGEVDVSRLGQAFGFADENGRRLLVGASEELSKDTLPGITRAIGENGSLLSVAYEAWQEGDDASNGRDTSPNLAHLPGHLFAVTEGTAQPNATYYLFREEEVPLESLLPITIDGQTITDSDLARQIENEKDRELQQLWRLADVGGKADLYLALFRPDGPNHLFCLILEQEDTLAVLDFPATTEDSYSVWRMDDQGEIAPDHFSYLFAARTNAPGILLGMEWLGTEGSNALVLHGMGDRMSQIETRYGRYMSP